MLLVQSAHIAARETRTSCFRLDASTSVQDGWLWDYAICDPDQKSSLGFGPCPVTRKKLMTMRANETKSSYSDEGPNAGEHLFTWLPEPTDPAFRSECMFLYFRFQFPLQLPCEGNGTLGARVALSVARREGFGKVVRFILVSGLYAKMLAIVIKFTQAYRAKTTPDNPVANLGLRTQLNTPCAICMIFACFCDRSQTNKNRVAKNVHDAKWAPEEQGCLALTNLLVSLVAHVRLGIYDHWRKRRDVVCGLRSRVGGRHSQPEEQLASPIQGAVPSTLLRAV